MVLKMRQNGLHIGRSEFCEGGGTKMALSLTNRFVKCLRTNFENFFTFKSVSDAFVQFKLKTKTRVRAFQRNKKKHLNEAIVGDNFLLLLIINFVSQDKYYEQ